MDRRTGTGVRTLSERDLSSETETRNRRQNVRGAYRGRETVDVTLDPGVGTVREETLVTGRVQLSRDRGSG